MNDQNTILTEAITAGLSLLSSDDIKVSTKDIEALANFKGILKGIISGELILASPDRIIPDDDGSPKREPEKELD